MTKTKYFLYVRLHQWLTSPNLPFWFFTMLFFIAYKPSNVNIMHSLTTYTKKFGGKAVVNYQVKLSLQALKQNIIVSA